MMLTIKALREKFLPDLSTPIMCGLQASVMLLTLEFLVAEAAAFDRPREHPLTVYLSIALLCTVATLAAVAVVFLEMGRRKWKRLQSRRAQERLYELLRSRGHTPERAASLVGIGRALVSSGYDWQDSNAITRGVPADADIAEAILRRMPEPDRRHRFLEISGYTVVGALLGLALMVYFELAIAPPDYPFLSVQSWNATLLASWFGAIAGFGMVFGLAHWRSLRQRSRLRRQLERCRNAGLDTGAAALLLLLTPPLLRNDKKATTALSAAS